VSAPANLQPDDDIQGSVNWVGEEPRLACCVCDNYQQPINTRAAPRFLLQPMQYSPVSGHTGSQCFDEGDRGNWADRWFHGTRVRTRVGHTGPGYPSTRVLTFLECPHPKPHFCSRGSDSLSVIDNPQIGLLHLQQHLFC